jgi:hypothetical protein
MKTLEIVSLMIGLTQVYFSTISFMGIVILAFAQKTTLPAKTDKFRSKFTINKGRHKRKYKGLHCKKKVCDFIEPSHQTLLGQE